MSREWIAKRRMVNSQPVASFGRENELRFMRPMKMLPILALVLLGLVSCASEPRVPSRQAGAQAKPELKISYTRAGSYTQSGRNWKIVVVKGPLTDSELIALARDLHKTYGGESIEIFDDVSQIAAYEKWAKGMPGPGRSPYPEKWVNQHHIGMVNKMLAPGGATWQLLGGSAHPTSPESKIVDLN